jgi:hypothetical protein
LTEISGEEKLGLYEYSLAEKKCISLLPGVGTFGTLFAADGKSFLCAVPSQHDVNDLSSAQAGWSARWADSSCAEAPVCVSAP